MTDLHLSPPLLAKGGGAVGSLQAQQRRPERGARTARLTAVLFCTGTLGKINARAALPPSVEFLQQTGYL